MGWITYFTWLLQAIILLTVLVLLIAMGVSVIMSEWTDQLEKRRRMQLKLLGPTTLSSAPRGFFDPR